MWKGPTPGQLIWSSYRMCIFLTVICKLFTILVTMDATKPCVWASFEMRTTSTAKKKHTYRKTPQGALSNWIVLSSLIFLLSQLVHAVHRLRGRPTIHCETVRHASDSAWCTETLALEAGATSRYISSTRISTGLLLRLVQGMESVSWPRCPNVCEFDGVISREGTCHTF